MWASGLELARRLSRSSLLMVLILFFGEQEYNTISCYDIEYLVNYRFGCTAGPADPLDPPRLHSLLNTDKAWAYLLMVLILFYSDLEYNILSYDDIYN